LQKIVSKEREGEETLISKDDDDESSCLAKPILANGKD